MRQGEVVGGERQEKRGMEEEKEIGQRKKDEEECDVKEKRRVEKEEYMR